MRLYFTIIATIGKAKREARKIYKQAILLYLIKWGELVYVNSAGWKSIVGMKLRFLMEGFFIRRVWQYIR